MTRIGIIGPPADAGRVAGALEQAGFEPVVEGADVRRLDRWDAVVVDAFADHAPVLLELAALRALPAVLSCTPGPETPLPGAGSSEAGCLGHSALLRADAYVWRHGGVASALEHILAEDRAARTMGPLRLVFLGHGGADYTRAGAEAVGTSYEVVAKERIFIGRPSQPVTIRFTTAVARHHAYVERSGDGVQVVDCGSTNGTWYRGQRQDRFSLEVGEELAVAGFLRMRLDGDPRGSG